MKVTMQLLPLSSPLSFLGAKVPDPPVALSHSISRQARWPASETTPYHVINGRSETHVTLQASWVPEKHSST